MTGVCFRDLESDICDLEAMITILMELQGCIFDHPDKTDGALKFYSIPKQAVEGRTVLMTQVADMSTRLRERFYEAHETSRAAMSPKAVAR